MMIFLLVMNFNVATVVLEEYILNVKKGWISFTDKMGNGH